MVCSVPLFSALRREVLDSGDASVYLPVNLKRLIWKAKTKFGITSEAVVCGKPRCWYN